MLPHPVTTFILGIMLVSLIYLFFELKRYRSEVQMMTTQLNRIEDRLDRSVETNDAKIEDISKKIDSRVDKAISSLKKELKA